MAKAADEFLQQCNDSDIFPDVFAFLASKEGLSDREQVDALLVDQYQRWKSNQVIPVDQYLARTPEISDLAKVDLLLEEYGYLEQRGIAPAPGSFANRYDTISTDAKQELLHGLGIETIDGQLEDTVDNFDTENGQSKPQPELVGRYQIIRVLGKGAFGRVFLARDPDLDRSVAIKVPSDNRIRMGGGTEEYLAEARAVAKLEHTNIVPVYDCGTTEDGRCFVVSKFIRGKELRAELRKGLTHRESAFIACSLAKALHAAHVGGIVHRDVKPSNIIIDSNRQPHLLDFGLALREQDAFDSKSLVGTPAYMSPEQAEGGNRRIDGRSDIYSLGVVFYEMLTGHRPLKSDNARELLDQLKLGEVRPPRQSNDSISPELERICLKALSRKLAERYNTAKDMAGELENWLAQTSTDSDSLSFASSASHASASAQRLASMHDAPKEGSLLGAPLKVFFCAVGLVLLAVMVLTNPPWKSKPADFLLSANRHRAETVSTDPIASKVATASNPARIAVLGFRNFNEASDSRWKSIGFAELLAEELQKSPEFDVVSNDESADARNDLDLAISDTLAASTLKRIDQRLETDWVIVGSWTCDDESDKTRLTVNFQSTSHPDQSVELTSEVSNDRWIEACPSTAAKIREHLCVKPPDVAATGNLFPAVPSAAAAEDYFKGLGEIRCLRLASGISLLDNALAYDSKSPLVHDRLSRALKRTGNWRAAAEHAAKAVEFGQSLPRTKQLAMKGRLNLLRGNPADATIQFREIFELGKGKQTARLQLASALVQAGRGHEALKLIGEVNKESVAATAQIELDLAAAEAALSVSDLSTLVEHARLAGQRANQTGARAKEAQAKLLQGRGHRRLSEHDDASLCYEQALKIFRDNEDSLNEAATLAAWGKALIDNGQLDVAQSKIDDALKTCEAIDSSRLTAQCKRLLGEIHIYRGQFEDAIKQLHNALYIHQQAGNQSGIAKVNLTLCNVMARTGKLDEALKMVSQARKAFQAAGNRLAEARTWGQEGAMRGRAGDIHEAKRHFERALELFREVGDRRNVAICLADLASTNSGTGNLTKAAELYSEAIEIHRQIGSKRGPEMLMFNLSKLYIRTGRFDEAWELMNESFSRFQKAEKWMNAVFVQQRIADLQLKRGELEIAAETLDAVLEKSKEVGAMSTQAQSMYMQFHIDLLRGEKVKALSHLRRSREIRVELNEEVNMASCDMALARTKFEAGQPQEALQLINACATKLIAMRPELKPMVFYLRSRIEMANGDSQKAQVSFASAQKAEEVSQTQNITIQLSHQHERALALAELGRVDEAIDALTGVSAVAEKCEWRSLKWEAELQCLELKARAGQRIDANRVSDLSDELAGKGFLDFEKRLLDLRNCE